MITEFDIESEYSIPSNMKPYLIKVKEHTLPAKFGHFSIPKVDRDAFLTARVTGWEDFDILDGIANIYYGNTYIGQADINIRGIYQDNYWIGISYRSSNDIIAMLGLKINKFIFGYAFDFTTSDIKTYSSGSHEIMLGYNFGEGKNKRKMKYKIKRFYCFI